MARGGVTFKQLDTAFSHGNFDPLYLLYGEETFLIDALQQRLIDCALGPGERDFNLDIIYGAEADARQALTTCASFPVMAPRRVVIIRDFEKMKDNRLFKAYAEQPNPTAVVALVCRSKPNLSAHPYRALKEKAVAAEIKPLSAARVPGWIVDRVKASGLEISPRACEMLADFVGTDLQTAAAEIDKLTSYIGDRKTIEEIDVIRASGQTREYNVFELQKAVGGCDYTRSMIIMERLLQQTSNVRGECIRIVTILSSYFTKLWKLTICQGRRLGEKEIASRIGVSPYFIKEYIHNAKNFDQGSLEGCLTSLLAADYELKGGAQRSEHMVMQLLVGKLTDRGSVFAPHQEALALT